jgi:hypothetical protein
MQGISQSFRDFAFNPLAIQALRGEDQQQTFMQADSLIDLLEDFAAPWMSWGANQQRTP